VARKVVWTDPAVEDLESIIQFIARDSAAYAATLAQAFCDAGDSLADFGDRGHRVRDRQLADFRELLVGRYRLVYRAEQERVLIVGVFHGSRQIRKLLRGRRARK